VRALNSGKLVIHLDGGSASVPLAWMRRCPSDKLSVSKP
jgi:hypothetical protein